MYIEIDRRKPVRFSCVIIIAVANNIVAMLVPFVLWRSSLFLSKIDAEKNTNQNIFQRKQKASLKEIEIMK